MNRTKKEDIMIEITAGVEGMMCQNCEAHVTKAIEKNFKTKSVKASRDANQVVILAKKEIGEDELKAVIKDAGYEMTSYSRNEK